MCNLNTVGLGWELGFKGFGLESWVLGKVKLDFWVGLILGERVLSKGAEYTYRKLGH